MNGDLTVRDVMTREFVGVSEGDVMSGVAELMAEADVEAAVVLRGTTPLGMVDASDLVALVAAGSDADSVLAGVAMSEPSATIDPDASVREAVSTFAALDARRLVVVDGDEVLGTLSEHDVIAAQATLPDSEVEEPPLSAPAEGAPPDDRYSTQSVCEACGSLAGSLASVNGQLLCADCREM